MKNLIFSLLAFCCLFAAPAAAHHSQSNEPLVVRSQLFEGGLEVLIANLEKQTATISFTSLDGRQQMFTDRITKHNGYSYKLNLDQLPHGRYLLTVKKGDAVRQQVIVIGEVGVLCSDWK